MAETIQMDEVERYLFDLQGYLVIQDVLSAAEVAELNRLFDGLAGVNRHHGSSVGLRMNQHQVTSSLAIFHESGALECPNHSTRSQRRKFGHDQAGTVTRP